MNVHWLPMFPFVGVAADSVYGVGDIEAVLRRAGKGYVLGVNANHWFGSWCTKPLIAGEAKDIAAGLPKKLGSAFPQGQEPKARVFMTGPISNWLIATVTCVLWTRGLLIRRNPTDGDMAYSRHGVPRAPRSRHWSGSKAPAGASRKASRPPRTNLASIIMRHGPGTAGTGMFHW